MLPEFDWSEYDEAPRGPSPGQLEFLEDLRYELGVDLNVEATESTGRTVADLRSLSIDEASELIQTLKERRRNGGRD